MQERTSATIANDGTALDYFGTDGVVHIESIQLSDYQYIWSVQRHKNIYIIKSEPFLNQFSRRNDLVLDNGRGLMGLGPIGHSSFVIR